MTALVILALAVGAAVWIRSFSTHPNTACPKCKGAKEIFHPLFKSARGPCPTCGGSGQVRRRGRSGPLR